MILTKTQIRKIAEVFDILEEYSENGDYKAKCNGMEVENLFDRGEKLHKKCKNRVRTVAVEKRDARRTLQLAQMKAKPAYTRESWVFRWL